MPRARFVWALAGLAPFTLALALPVASMAQTVWSGFDIGFSKANFANPTLPENQDRITDDVWLTRSATQGLFNIRTESGYSATSPAGTEWATGFMLSNMGKTIAATNWDNLNFTTWMSAYGGGGSLAFNITNFDAVVRLVGDDMTTDDDIYLDLRFTNWAVGSAAGGGFAYMRSMEPITPAPTGDYNGNGVVDAADYVLWRSTLDQTVGTPGDGADGDVSGTIDAGDYDFWRARFGNVVAPPGHGAGLIAAVPEPTSAALLLIGLIGFQWCSARRLHCARHLS